MHEMGLTQEIVALVCQRTQGQRVNRVVLEIGKLAAVLPEALQFCFELCVQETNLEGAELEIIEIPGKARCMECGTEMILDKPFGRCTCGNTFLEWLTGEELRIKQLELA